MTRDWLCACGDSSVAVCVSLSTRFFVISVQSDTSRTTYRSLSDCSITVSHAHSNKDDLDFALSLPHQVCIPQPASALLSQTTLATEKETRWQTPNTLSHLYLGSNV